MPHHEQLAERYRAPLVLCYLQSQTRDEAARQLGLSLRTLDRRLEQGRMLLRARLERRGLVFSTTLILMGLTQRRAAALAPRLLRAAVEAACSLEAVSTRVSVLASVVLQSMPAGRRYLVAAIVLVAGLLAGATGALARRAMDPEPPGLLDVETGREMRQLPGTAAQIMGLAFSPDGRRLAYGGNDKAVHVLNTTTGHEVHTFAGRGRATYHLAFSPDGRMLAGAEEDGRIDLWDLLTGVNLHKWNVPVPEGLEGVRPRLAFAPDGQTLYLGSADGLRAWDIGGAAPARKLLDHDVSVYALAIAADGKTLWAGLRDGAVCVLDAQTGKQVKRWQAYGCYPVETLALSPDEKTVATGTAWLSRIRLWDAQTGRELNPCPGHQGTLTNLIFANIA